MSSLTHVWLLDKWSYLSRCSFSLAEEATQLHHTVISSDLVKLRYTSVCPLISNVLVICHSVHVSLLPMVVDEECFNSFTKSEWRSKSNTECIKTWFWRSEDKILLGYLY